MLGVRIAALRKDAGLSQAELAARLKISASAVGMYEQGRREPSLDILVDMAELFGVSMDYLTRGLPANRPEQQALEQMVLGRLSAADTRAEARQQRPFSRQELAVLFAAMLIE